MTAQDLERLDDCGLREQISRVVCGVLEPLSEVLAGWESGSAAFDAVDNFSDIDLFFLVADDASDDQLYAVVEASLLKLSSITACHDAPSGRYYQLEAAGEYLLVDLCLVRESAPERYLDVEGMGMSVRCSTKGGGCTQDPSSVRPWNARERIDVESFGSGSP